MRRVTLRLLGWLADLALRVSFRLDTWGKRTRFRVDREQRRLP